MRVRFATNTSRHTQLILLLFFSLTGCSLLLDFGSDDLPCSPTGACLNGYRCLTGLCVATGSLAPGSACNHDSFCQEGLLCADSVCRKPCTWAFLSGAAASCEADEICLSATRTDESLTTVCLPGSCQDRQCIDSSYPNRGCVNLDTNAASCITACTITCTSGACTDDCQPDALGTPTSCQPITASATTMACLPRGTATHASPCDLVSNPCAVNFACIRGPSGTGTCLAYCDSNVSGSCGSYTDPAAPGLGTTAPCNPTLGPFSVCGSAP